MKKFDAEIITRMARKQKLSLGNAEKDYALSVALSVLSDVAPKLVFKGGTCIKKVYYPEFRFSSDLDFTAKRAGEFRGEIGGRFENKEIHGVDFSRVKTIETRRKDNLILSLQYASRISQARYVDSIRTEFSSENPVLLDPKNSRIINPPEYGLPETVIPCMALEEILAEKIHAIYHRRKPRDLYDLTYLLKKGIQPNYALIAAKLKPVGAELDAESFRKRTEILKETWKADLSQILLEAPDFESVRNHADKSLFASR